MSTDALHDLHTIFSATRIDDVELELRVLGHLVHRGTIVAQDPLAGDAESFATRFPSGCHRVEALIGRRNGDERVVLARVVFSDAVPATFELATRADEDVRMLAPEQRFGYGVDAGTGCFATPEALADVATSDALLAELDKHRRLTWCWAALNPSGGGHALIAFSSGYGDGFYASYIGRAADATPVCLVTNFSCVDLQLPTVVDDPVFRRTYATACYQRVKAAVALLGTAHHGDAYVAASELVGSPADVEHLADQLIADLRGARGELERDLFLFVVGRVLRAQAVQRALAPHLGSLDRQLFDRIRATPEDLDPAFFGAVAALPARDDTDVRRWFLELGVTAKQLTDDDAALLLRRAGEALETGDEQLVQSALRVFDHRAAHGLPLPAETIAQVRTIGRTATELRTQRSAFRVLVRAGADVSAELSATDPRTRLAAAGVIGREHAAHAEQVCIAIANDTSLPLELRHQAMNGIRDESTKVATCIALALAGDDQAAGTLRWVMTDEAIAALERLAAEASSTEVRAVAARVLKTRRDIAAMKAQA